MSAAARPLGLLAAIVLAVSLMAADPPVNPANRRLGASAQLETGKATAAQPPGTAPGQPGEKVGEKIREGTKLSDELGSFSRVGERVSFAPGKGESLRCLENLALERIARAIDESQGQRQWVVSGVVTEFRGANYLLVTKAVIRLQDGETATGP